MPSKSKFVCKYCGKEFIGYVNQRTKTRDYCSKKCAALARSKYKNLEKKRINGSTKYKLVCQYCGKEYWGAKPDSKYCSLDCSAKAKRINVVREKICPVCGKHFVVKDGYAAKHQKYCSRQCAQKNNPGNAWALEKWRKENGNHSWNYKGDKNIKTDGYVYAYVDVNNRRKEHILIAENILGRKLKENECVHHINGDKKDNNHKNLLICTNSYHRYIENLMGYLYKRQHFGHDKLDDVKNIIAEWKKHQRKKK